MGFLDKAKDLLSQNADEVQQEAKKTANPDATDGQHN